MFGKPKIPLSNTGKDEEMAISFPVRLGRRLSDLREKRCLSQTQLADMAGSGGHILAKSKMEPFPPELILFTLGLRRSI
jgi:hypothetical protein